MYYSQSQEDIFLNENIFKNKRNGTYIELGALDGVLYSNTKFFEDMLGWKGILIEPHPYAFSLLEKNRPNNYLFNNLVSCYKEPLEFKYFTHTHFIAVSGVCNTLPQYHLNKWFNNYENAPVSQDTILLNPISLTEIVKKTDLSHINLLSLDVEGHEYEVLKSWDFSVPIDVILIEMLGENTEIEIEKEREQKCREILLNNNYKLFEKTKSNEFYILNEL